MATGIDWDRLGCCDSLHDLLVNHPDSFATTGAC